MTIGVFPISTNIILALLLAVYHCFIFSLTESFLAPEQHHRLKYALAAAANGLVGGFLYRYMLACNIVFVYLIYFAFFILEFFLLFGRKNPLLILLIAVSFLFSILGAWATLIAVYALFTRQSIYAVLDNPVHLARFQIILSLIIIASAFLMQKRFVRCRFHQNFRNKFQVLFLLAWISLCFFYFFINMKTYTMQIDNVFFTIEQLLKPLILLLGFYLLIFYSLTVEQMLNYQADNENLSFEIDNQKKYISSLIGKAFWVCEINLTKNSFERGLDMYQSILSSNTKNYSDIMKLIAKKIVHKDDQEKFLQFTDINTLLNNFEQGKTVSVLEYRRSYEASKNMWFRLTATIIQDAEIGDIWALGYVEDITLIRDEYENLVLRAQMDLLTGLYNKITTENMISDRLLTQKGTLIFADIDGFKLINDYLGHVEGDAVLCALAHSLKKLFRTDDIIGRVGGDEFLIFLYDLTELNIVTKKANALLKNFHNNFKDSSGLIHTISVSLGIRIIDEVGASFSEVYKQADAAMYFAKQHGKNRYWIYDDTENV